MTDVTVDKVTRRDFFCAYLIIFGLISRPKEGRIRFSESRRGGEKGRQKRADVGEGGCRFTRVYKL